MKEQTFANHSRVVPAFHMVALPILLLNVVYSIYELVHTWFLFGALVSLLVSIALLLVALYARMFALAVQDRVIRLEMRLRLEKLLPADLKPRIPEFTVSQLIALRFASDAELPDLTRRVLDEKVQDRKAIKQMIKTWKPDHLRA
ncbi:MAG TPA: DUF6526 family protein [Candidatus Dormibacteraeota bacterium]|nr:DUF6526 family protein [Candidatus Dormibacteraeota bacterium]